MIGSGGIARRGTIPEGITHARNADLVVVFDIAAKPNGEVAEQFHRQAARSIAELLGTLQLIQQETQRSD